jgi:hypothetical protein
MAWRDEKTPTRGQPKVSQDFRASFIEMGDVQWRKEFGVIGQGLTSPNEPTASSSLWSVAKTVQWDHAQGSERNADL